MAKLHASAFGSGKKKTVTRTITYKRKRPDGFWGRIVQAADRHAFNWNTRLAFYNHLAGQVENGTPVQDAIAAYSTVLAKRGRKSSAALVENIARRMREGMSLRKAIEIAVPRDEIAIISGGELSGHLEVALEVVITSRDRVDAVISAYREAISMPSFYMAITYLVIWGIGAYVVPSLTLTMPESHVSGLGLIMYKMADFAQSWWAVLPPVLVAVAIALIRWSLPRWKGPKRIFAEKMFPYSFYRDIEGFKWLVSFVGMMEAGMTDVTILAEQMAIATPWLRERLYHARFRMTDGGLSLAKALQAKGQRGMPPFEFPNPDILDSLVSIQGFDDFTVRARRVTDRWARDIEKNAKKRAKTIGIIAEMCVYGLMGLLMVAMNSVMGQLGTVGGY